NGSVLSNAGIGVVRTVGDLAGFAGSDAANVIVTPGDGRIHLVFGQLDFVLAERGLMQQFQERGKNWLEILLQAIEGDAGGICIAAGFHAGRAVLQKRVELIPCALFGTPSAPNRAIDAYKASLILRLG